METLHPKLRFPEFNSIWVKKSIGEITNVTAGGTPSTLNKEYWNGNIRWMNSGDLNLKRVNEVQNRITELGLKKSSTKFIPKNSILIGLAGQGKTRGTVAMNMIELCINQSIGAIFPNNELFISDFLYHNLDNRYDELRGLSTGDGGRGGLNLSIIKNLDVKLPSLEEQTRIANFLSSVDEKLNLLKEKKSLLEEYKKGIMQKIFNQEIRFKDDTSAELSASNGNDFEDWIETNLGGICEFENGKAHENEIDENGDFVVVNSKFVSTNGRVRKYTNKIISRLDKNDIVMVMSDVPNGKAIAKCYYIEEDNKYSLNQRICKIRVINNDSKYIYYLINRNPYYLAFDSGVGQTNLKKDEVLDCPLYIPKDVKEQTKIANFLSAIDEKINLVAEALEATNTYKKGLLQQMFV